MRVFCSAFSVILSKCYFLLDFLAHSKKMSYLCGRE